MKKKRNLTKLYVMIITLPKGKKEIVGDMLEYFDVTGYLYTLARGGYDHSISKEVMFCIIREDQIKDAMLAIEDRFKKFNSDVSMFYAIPLYSIIGVNSYMLLSNGRK